MMSMNPRFYSRVKQAGIRFEHVAEVGVYHPDTSNIYGFVMDGVRATLVEPEPNSIRLIRERFGERENMTLHTCALADAEGEVEFCHRESSTFLASLDCSPAIVNDRYEKSTGDMFTARAVTFDQIDDGSIDILSIDTEGSEWYVLKHMVSRPKVISLETHGGAYRNPYRDEITQWMRGNSYLLWYKDSSDSVYVRTGHVQVTIWDRVGVMMANLRILGESLRKRLSNRLKSHKRQARTQ